jgi:hypothetical protein
MSEQDLSAPRFPGLAAEAGGYESFYLKASHPREPLAFWMRYTVHKRPGAPPTGSLWVTLFDRGAGAPVALKQTLPDPTAPGGDLIRIGGSRFGAGEVSGRAQGGGRAARWELRYRTAETPLRHLPRDWMYSARLPKTKLLTTAPGAVFDGHLELDGRSLELEGWPGTAGHNWGAEHAERWIWLHGALFTGQPSTTWLDLALGRIRLGPLTTPWVANGALSLNGVRHRLGGIERLRSTDVDEAPDRCRFALAGRGVRVRGEVSAPRSAFVGWVYADPDGSEHHTVNCSAADLELDVELDHGGPLGLRCDAGAVYELGMRERDHGMEIQPFPDG